MFKRNWWPKWKTYQGMLHSPKYVFIQIIAAATTAEWSMDHMCWPCVNSLQVFLSTTDRSLLGKKTCTPLVRLDQAYRLSSQQPFWNVTVGKAQVLLRTTTMDRFSSSVPVRPDSEPLCITPGAWNRSSQMEFRPTIILICFSYCHLSTCLSWKRSMTPAMMKVDVLRDVLKQICHFLSQSTFFLLCSRIFH